MVIDDGPPDQPCSESCVRSRAQSTTTSITAVMARTMSDARGGFRPLRISHRGLRDLRKWRSHSPTVRAAMAWTCLRKIRNALAGEVHRSDRTSQAPSLRWPAHNQWSSSHLCFDGRRPSGRRRCCTIDRQTDWNHVGRVRIALASFATDCRCSQLYGANPHRVSRGAEGQRYKNLIGIPPAGTAERAEERPALAERRIVRASAARVFQSRPVLRLCREPDT